MYSEEDMTEEFSSLFDDWEADGSERPMQVDFSDKIVTRRCLTMDEAYDAVCDMEFKNFYSFTKINDGRDIWYKFRYEG